jgi:hypothetical protein
MTVHSIAKGLIQQEANMTAADKSSQQSAQASAEAAFASVLQQTTGRYSGQVAMPTAATALQAHFDRPATPARIESRKSAAADAKADDKPRLDKPQAKADKPQAPARSEARPQPKHDRGDDDQTVQAPAGNDDTQAAAPSDTTARADDDQAPQQAQSDDQAPQQGQQQADAQAAATVAAATQTTKLGDSQAKAAQAAAGTGHSKVVQLTAGTGNDDNAAQTAAANDDTDPFAWLDKQFGKEIKALEAQIDAGDNPADAAADFEAEFAAKIQAALQAGGAKTKAAGHAQAQGLQPTDQARAQADDLAQMLSAQSTTATRVEVKVQVTETTTVVQMPTGNPVLEALAALDAARDAAMGQQMQDPAQAGQPQVGQNGQAGQPVAAADAAVAATQAAEQANAAAAEDRPFAAMLAAQMEAGNQPAANSSVEQPQAVAGLAGVGSAQATDKAAPTQAAQPARRPIPVTPQQIVEQVSVQIDKAVKDGADTVKINLKPVELGKIEIKLDVGVDGKVSATITADRPETLAALQKDAKGLEKALNDAGLKSDTQAMSFNLRGEHQQSQADRGNNGGNRSGRSRGRALGAIDQTSGPAAAAAAAQARLGGRSGVDISV